MRYIYEHLKDTPVEIEYPADLEKIVNEGLQKTLIYNRYQKKAHCPYCGYTFNYIDKLRKGDTTYCPNCYTEVVAMPHTCIPISSYDSYVWMFYRNDTIYFVVAEAGWRYSGQAVDCIEDATTIKLNQIICISNQSQHMYVYRYYQQDWYQKREGGVYIGQGTYKNLVKKEQLEDTFLRYMNIDPGNADYMVKEAALCAKYPQVEFIKKAGLEGIISSKIMHYPTYIFPNWKGKTIAKFLRLSPQDVDKLKNWDMFDIEGIAFYKILSKTRKVKKSHLKIVRKIFAVHEIKSLNENFVRLATYLDKQAKLCNHPTHAVINMTKMEYKDYMRQLKYMEYPMNDYYKYPKDLKKAHDKVSSEYRAAFDERRKAEKAKKQKKYEEKYLPSLKKLVYIDDKYLIRPLRDIQDFDNEGRNNRNCVASYYDRAVEGRTSVFVVRKVGEENESFVTVELDLKTKSIKQCFGRGNTIPDDEVRTWVDNWLNLIVKKIKADKKGRVA